MKHLAVIALATALLGGVAHAQERNYSLTLTPSEIRLLGAALDEQKAKDVRPLMNKIEDQIAQQDQAARVATVESFKKQLKAEEAKKAELPPVEPAPKE